MLYSNILSWSDLQQGSNSAAVGLASLVGGPPIAENSITFCSLLSRGVGIMDQVRLLKLDHLIELIFRLIRTHLYDALVPLYE